MPHKTATANTENRPIVSSAHLVSPRSAEMSEFEFGLIVAGNALSLIHISEPTRH